MVDNAVQGVVARVVKLVEVIDEEVIKVVDVVEIVCNDCNSCSSGRSCAGSSCQRGSVRRVRKWIVHCIKPQCKYIVK